MGGKEWKFQILKSILMEREKKGENKEKWLKKENGLILYKEKGVVHGYIFKENWKT